MISYVEILNMPQKNNVINNKLIQQSNKAQSQYWKSVAFLYTNDQREKEIKTVFLDRKSVV